MSRETYSEIHATLDSFKAPSVGEGAVTISERIRGLHRELNEAAAKAVVDARERAETSASHSILDECNRTIAAERRAAALEGEAQRLRADVARLSARLDYATELCLAGFRQ